MVREDILTGLKNAVERGESLEQAKESLINAGYPRKEVEDAIASLSKAEEAGEIKEIKEIEVAPAPKGEPLAEVKKRKMVIPYFLIVIGVIILAFVSIFLFHEKSPFLEDIREEILDFLKPIGEKITDWFPYFKKE